ncbi:MAG: alpha/beta fold hydrolase, partial [Caldilineaceae bacterium]
MLLGILTLRAPAAQAQGVTRPAPPASRPVFSEAPCPFVAPWSDTVICGVLRVPERRANPSGATIELFVAILHSREPATDAPLLVLPGGPGGGALESRFAYYPLALRRTRDIILLDPRGAGASTPSLDCFEVDEPDELTPDLTAAYAACAERLLAEGRDLNGYVTSEQVEDVADLARALGIGTLNLYATSYGTRVAVMLAERYPDLVRSMVLDSVLPVQANALLEEPLNTWAVFRRVAQDCAADPPCNAAYPALESRLLALIDRYNHAPLPDDLGYGSGDDILRLLYHELFRGGARLPALISALHDGDFARACSLAPPKQGCFFAPHLQPDAAAPLQSVPPPDPHGERDGDWRNLFVHPDDPYGVDGERITWLMQQLGAATPDALFARLATMATGEVHMLLAALPRPLGDPFSEGAFATVICSEEAPFYTTADVERIALRIPPQLGDLPVQRAAAVAALCAFWPVQPVSPAAKVTALINTPALLLAGTHDPVTPPAWARRAAASIEG